MTMRLSTYRAYGISLTSDVLLPELELLSDEPKPSLSVTTSRSAPPEARQYVRYSAAVRSCASMTCARCEGGYLIRVSGECDFFVTRDGTRIIAFEPLPPPITLRHLLLDQVIPHALNLAGLDSLHATSVLSARGDIALIGPSGAGKSTLAARFIVAELPLVSDDCLIVRADSERIVAVPSYSGLRLMPDALHWMGRDLDTTTRVVEDGTKRRVAGNHMAAKQGGLLVAIYVLGGSPVASMSEPVVIEPLMKSDALSQLLDCSYRLDVEDKVMVKRQFDLFTEVGNAAWTRRLTARKASRASAAAASRLVAQSCACARCARARMRQSST